MNAVEPRLLLQRRAGGGLRVALALAVGALPLHAGAAEAGSSPGVVEKVEHAVEHGAKAAASGVERGLKAAARGVERGASAAASGVARGAHAAASGVERGVRAAAGGVERGAKATQRALGGSGAAASSP